MKCVSPRFKIVRSTKCNLELASCWWKTFADSKAHNHACRTHACSPFILTRAGFNSQFLAHVEKNYHILLKTCQTLSGLNGCHWRIHGLMQNFSISSKFFKYHPKDSKATCSGDMVHNHVRTKNDFRSTGVYSWWSWMFVCQGKACMMLALY